MIGGFESMFYMREEFERYGIDPDLLGGILDADPEAVSEVSLRLMEKMIEAREMDSTGQTHLIRRGMAIPDCLIDWVISCSFDAMSWNDELEVSRDLIVLIRSVWVAQTPSMSRRVTSDRGRAMLRLSPASLRRRASRLPSGSSAST